MKEKKRHWIEEVPNNQVVTQLMSSPSVIFGQPEGDLASEESHQKNSHANFMHVFFNYAYYLLLCPFRLQKQDDNSYIIRKSLPQQVLCACFTSLATFRMFTSLRFALVETYYSRNPQAFFNVFCDGCSLLFKTLTFKALWTKSDTFGRLINFLNSPYLIPYNPYKIESMQTIIIFCGAYAVLSFLRLFFGHGFINCWDWSPEWLSRRLVADARSSFFIDVPKNISSAPLYEEISSTDIFITVVNVISIQVRFITGFFVDLFILIHVMTLWAPVSGFNNLMYGQISNCAKGYLTAGGTRQQTGHQRKILEMEVSLALNQFDALKTLSYLIEEAIGDVILPYFLEALFYYALFFESFIFTRDIVKRLVLTFFYTSALCILTFSSEIVKKMRWFKMWLGDERRYTLLSPHQLNMVVTELADNSVSISASGMTTIDYSFFGTVSVVLITFFIIKLQSVVVPST